MPRKTSKKSASSKSSGSEWAKLLGEALRTREEKPRGKGWLKLKDLILLWGIGRSRTLKLISVLTEEGKVEVHNGTELAPSGRLVIRVWYRIKK